MSDTGRNLDDGAAFASRVLDMSSRLTQLERVAGRFSQPSFRNLIVNGDMGVWQRGPGPFATLNNVTADRFDTPNGGSGVSTTRQAFSLGNTIEGKEPPFYLCSVVTSVAGAGNYAVLSQSIEDVRTLAGQWVTLSFWAKAEAAKNIAIELQQAFGTGGAPSASVSGIGSQLVALTTAWKRYSVTIRVPSIAGKTVGTTTSGRLALNVWLDAGANFNARTASLGQQSGTFDFWGVQLEAGSAATTFEQLSPGVTLALCQRYFQRHIDPPLRGVYGATNIFNRSAITIPTMRAAPTATMSGTFSWYDGTSTSTSTTYNNLYATVNKVELDGNLATAVMVVGRAAVAYQGVGGILDLSAEAM